MSGSPYVRMLKNKLVPLNPSYLHEVEVLRAMLRQEARQGDSGWGGSWTQERYQTLKEKHPEALMAFQTELVTLTDSACWLTTVPPNHLPTSRGYFSLHNQHGRAVELASA
jgi:hypothetical protein